MKKYFRKWMAMLLAMCMVMTMLPVIEAEAASYTVGLSGLTLTERTNDTDPYVYKYNSVSVSGGSGYRTMIIMVNGDAPVTIDVPANVSKFTPVTSDLTDMQKGGYARVNIGEDVDNNAIANYIKGVTFTATNAEKYNIEVLLSSQVLDNAGSADNVEGNIVYLDGHFYEFRTVPKHKMPSWDQAKDDAEERYFLGAQGYLATITSAEEHAKIQELRTGYAVWLGGRYLPAEGNRKAGFYWVTGPENGKMFLEGAKHTDNSGNDIHAPYGKVLDGLHFWTNCAADVGNCICNENFTGLETANIAPVGRTEPNNSNNEQYLQMTKAGRWNDLRGWEYVHTGETVPSGGSSVDKDADDDIPKGYIVEYEPNLANDSATDTTASGTGILDTHTVTFDVDGEKTTVEVPNGGKVNKPTDPIATAEQKKVFDNWYKDNSKWSFDNAVTSNITLTAEWISYPQVSYDDDGLKAPVNNESVTLENQNETVVIDTVGGSNKNGDAHGYTWSDAPSDCGDYSATETSTVSLEPGNVLTLNDPEKTNYVFSGWTMGVAEIDDGNDGSTSAVKFTATWVENATVIYNSYPNYTSAKTDSFPMYPTAQKITIDLDGGKYAGDANLDKITLESGENKLNDPDERAEYDFLGWDYDETDVKFTAKWIEDPKVTYTNGDGSKGTVHVEDGTDVTIDPDGGTGGEYTYNTDSSKEYDTSATVQMTNNADVLNLNKNPGKTGYAFVRWEWNSSTKTLKAVWAADAAVRYFAYVNDSTIPNDTDLTSQTLHTYPEVTINLALDGGTYTGDVPSKLTEAGVTIGIPTKTGYTFRGWVYEKTNDVVTLTAKWTINQYTITFANTGDITINPITLDYGTAVTAPADPTKTGYTFAGWNPTIPSTMPEGGMEITAQWTVNQYKLTFNDSNGELLFDMTMDYGSPISVLTPTKTGHTFAGWDTTIPATMPAENLTFKAQWTVNQYTIKFENTGDGTIEDITQDYGTAVTAPANPTKTGYTFKGWDKEIPATMPEGGVTITAQWTINQYTITFADTGDKMIAPITQDYNTAVTKPADPTQEGHTFAGWFDEANNATSVPEKMPAEDLVLTAKWYKNPTVSYTTAVEGPKNTDKTSVDKTDFSVGSMIEVELGAADAELTYKVGSVKEEFIAAEGNTSVTITVAEGKNIILNDPTRPGYVFVGWERDGNKLVAKWEVDAVDAAKPGQTGDDGIPDIYQRTVTFTVVGGSWKTGGKANVVQVVTLKVGNKWDLDATISIDLPAVGAPDLGYENSGSWSDGLGANAVNVTISESTANNVTYTYQFVKVGNLNILYQDANDTNFGFVSLEREGVEVGKTITLVDGETTVTYDTRGGSDALKDAWDADGDDVYEIPAPADKDGFVFTGWEKSVDANGNYVLTAKWEIDELDADDPASGKGDGIPDKYQKKVTFKVEGGTFKSNKGTELVQYVTLMSAGYWSENGSEEVTVPTDMEPVSGYTSRGRWDKIQEGVTTVTVEDDVTYTYTFSRYRPAPSKPSEEDIVEKVNAMIPEEFTRDHIAYISGYEDNTVRPEAYITRAEVATIFYNLLQDDLRSEYYSVVNPFTDVLMKDWFNPAVSTIAELGLLTGYPDDSFAPGKRITRAEFAAILARLECDIELKKDVAFTDIEGHWAEDAILLVAARGWVGGYPDGSFKPQAYITRAEAMAMINNMLQRNPQTIDDLHENMKFWIDNSDPDMWYYIDVQEATKDHEYSRHEDGTEARAE